MLRPVGLGLVIAVCGALTAEAQDYTTVHPFNQLGKTSAPPEAGYVGGYERFVNDQRIVVDFFTYLDRAATRDGRAFGQIAVARRSVESSNGEMHVVSWADGRQCEGLLSVLVEFGRLEAPRLVTPPLVYPPVADSTLFGPRMSTEPRTTSVWGLARQADGALMTMTLSGQVGLISAWGDYAEQQLAPCWQEQQPTIQGVA